QHLPGDSPQQTTPHYSGGLRAKLDSRSGETLSQVQTQEQSTNRSVSTITVPSPYPACPRAYRLMHGLASRRRNFMHVEAQLCTGKWRSRKSRREWLREHNARRVVVQHAFLCFRHEWIYATASSA